MVFTWSVPDTGLNACNLGRKGSDSSLQANKLHHSPHIQQDWTSCNRRALRQTDSSKEHDQFPKSDSYHNIMQITQGGYEAAKM